MFRQEKKIEKKLREALNLLKTEQEKQKKRAVIYSVQYYQYQKQLFIKNETTIQQCLGVFGKKKKLNFKMQKKKNKYD